MKVVIFCGGMGVRMGGAARRTPKPLIPIGQRPILWHIMNWYASWGHDDFVLCLGHRARAFRRVFEAVWEERTNGSSASVLPDVRSIGGWRIRFLETGARSSVGARLAATRPYIDDDDIFLCTYGDGLTDAPLDAMIDRLVTSDKTGLLLSVPPRLSYHVVDADDDGVVRSIAPMSSAGIRINGGFFVFRGAIFDELRPEEDLVDTLARLAAEGNMITFPYDGFWAPMDTLKDKQELDEIAASGTLPWDRPHTREPQPA